MADLDREFQSPNESKLLEYLVVDSGAIIRGHGMSFPKLAKKIVTVQEVLVEIRDSKARQFLEALPYDIDIRSPSDEAMRAIAQFSKKTGDFAALSLTDIKLMALLYSLEVESKGSSDHIRSEPKGRSRSLQSKSQHGVPSPSPRPTPDSQHIGIHSTSSNNVAAVGDGDEKDSERDVIEEGTDSLQENPNEGAANSDVDHDDEDDDVAIVDLSDEASDDNAPPYKEGSTIDDALSLSKPMGVRFLDDEDFPPLAKAIGVFDDEEFPPLGQAMRALDDVDVFPELDVALEVDNEEALTVENEALHDLCCGHLGHEHGDDDDAMGSVGWTSVVSSKSMKTSQSPKSQAPSVPAPKLPMSWAAVTAKPKANPVPPTPSAWTKKEPIPAMFDVAAAAGGTTTTTASKGEASEAPPQPSGTTAWGDQGVSTSWAAIASARPPLPPSEDLSVAPPPSEVPPPAAQLEATQSTSITSTDSTDGLSQKTKAAVRPPQEKKQQLPSRILSGGGGFSASRVASERAAMEDDGKGWVNSSNIGAARAHGGGFSLSAPRTADVDESALTALVTTDFSMQNVLLQMSLNVMSVDGLLLRRVKQFVLRCIGCHTVHYDMDRLFCSKCGGAHMTRVAASVDTRSGELRLHLKKNYHMNLRGTKFALPKPGSQKRYSGEILLREDQMLAGIWKQKVAAVRRDVRSAFGEDVTSDVGLHVNKGMDVVVGMGKKNPNAMKGRERRGKKKKN